MPANVWTACDQEREVAPNTVRTVTAEATSAAGAIVSSSTPPYRPASTARTARGEFDGQPPGAARPGRLQHGVEATDQVAGLPRESTTTSSAGLVVASSRTASSPRVPPPTTATRSPGTGTAASTAVAMHPAGSISAAARRSAPSGSTCCSRAGIRGRSAHAPGRVNPVSS